MQELLQTAVAWVSEHADWWTFIGLFGQGLFMMRFVMQWIASERVKQSVVPEIFWYFSLGGGLVLFVYAIHKEDLVFILGQGLGLIIYLRNIHFIRRPKAPANA